MAEAVAGRRERRHAARRGRHRHRQDARLSDSRDPQPPAGARLHRHEEPAGADLLQGPARAPRGARPRVHRDADEGALELPVPAPVRAPGLGSDSSEDDGGSFADARAQLASPDATRRPDHRCSCRSSASGRRRPRPAIAPSCATCRRTCRSGRRSRPSAETCLGTECPRYGDCFVTLMRQRAAESDVVIVNHHLLCADAAVRQGDVRRSGSGVRRRWWWTRRISSRTWRRSTSASR